MLVFLTGDHGLTYILQETGGCQQQITAQKIPLELRFELLIGIK